MSPVRRLPEKRWSTTRVLVVMVDGIDCRAGPESCMMLFLNAISIVLVVVCLV